MDYEARLTATLIHVNRRIALIDRHIRAEPLKSPDRVLASIRHELEGVKAVLQGAGK